MINWKDVLKTGNYGERIDDRGALLQERGLSWVSTYSMSLSSFYNSKLSHLDREMILLYFQLMYVLAFVYRR